MSPEGFQQRDEPEPRARRILADLRDVPQHCGMATGDLRPCEVRVPANWRPYGATQAVCGLPC